ncbi:hypothetical protein ACIQWZ_37340 [Streptomyces sp. NPDC098077]|uniref:hypothetical protein n=1 Tax=Streptomyces sp. NPDC098077 TaxID=3366093 RepID=UPI0037F7F73F
MRPTFSSYISACAIGAVIGISGPAIATRDGKVDHIASAVLSSGWCYAALAFSFGLTSKSKMVSAISGTVALLAAVLSYYVTKATQGEFVTTDLSDPTGKTTQFGWGEFTSITLLWFLFACTLGPALGVAGGLSRHAGYPSLCRITVPVIAFTETSMRLNVESSMAEPIIVETWSIIRVAAAVGGIALLGLYSFGSKNQKMDQMSST